jgi:dipeptidyl aminopeptidase/acylaminoacyl peptidase
VQRAGLTIEAWLLKPFDFDPARQYPMVLDVHGGPQGFHGYDFDPVQQLLAAQGFLVVFCNPRGSVTYGRTFTRHVWQDWGGEDYLDLMAVVDAALERPYVDRERLGIYGSSYGGYMTAWAITQTRRFKAAVSRAPVSTWSRFTVRATSGTPGQRASLVDRRMSDETGTRRAHRRPLPIARLPRHSSSMAKATIGVPSGRASRCS